MPAMTDYLENALLNHVFRNTAYTPSATLYLALYTVAPTDSTSGTEVTGGSYARQAVAFAAPSGGAVASSGALTFSNMPSCTVVAAAICSAITGGNILVYKAVAPSKTYSAGDTVTIAAGDITASMD